MQKREVLTANENAIPKFQHYNLWLLCAPDIQILSEPI